MAELHDTDRYDPSRDPFKFCAYCTSPVAKGRHSITVGLCDRHFAIYQEDIESGFRQNRLKSLIDVYEANQKTSHLITDDNTH